MISPKIENVFIELQVNTEGVINKIVAGKFATKEFAVNTCIYNSCPYLFGTLEALPYKENYLIEGMIISSDNEEYNVDMELYKDQEAITILIHNRTHIYKTITKLNQNRNDLFFLKKEIAEKNKQLDVLRKESDKANEEKSRFLAMMSHEVRNPLNTILGYTELISKEKLSNKVSEYVGYLTLAGKNLKVIVDDILDLSRIEAGKLELASEEININEILKSTFLNYKIQNKNNLVALEFSASQKIPKVLLGDGVRITQVIANLMSNALKFTKKGKVTLLSEMLTENQTTTEIRISISDTGRGMTDEQTVKIFEEYSQTKLNDNRIHGGAGLGLSIVKRLVSAMNGSISVDSVLQKGTTFSIDIPFQKVVKVADHKMLKNDILSTKTLKGKRVLLADDDLLNQKITGYFLKKENSILTLVKDGLDALDALNNHDFDIVILDIHMPGLTGEELIEKKPNLAKNTTTSFLALTGNATAEYREEYMKIGFDEVIFKPYRPAELIDTILNCL
ncbi:hybrid sensor histidine kinase/response regulator [Polaribacter sp. R77954]|uniref:hybrid sensor histidine kinase/response regulator n=1 Tax=Polaribacter sp. R77954 TaxID=3093870 RepID=UPI0037C52C64